jgi:hypothetical protein
LAAAAVVDFLGGMLTINCSDGEMEGYLMLLAKGRLSKSIERRIWWKRWGFSSGMRRALGWGCACFIVALQNGSVHQINKMRRIVHSYLGRI